MSLDSVVCGQASPDHLTVRGNGYQVKVLHSDMASGKLRSSSVPQTASTFSVRILQKYPFSLFLIEKPLGHLSVLKTYLLAIGESPGR